ncbi:LuxR C-terminal-related transcriptional regulator [Kitasatospora sp. NPDC002227]|uniref:ATP-binding protein n=1 Tax=Kitasatospora sp. NPDC002227 TaxID=3154773 RepID=UPI003323E08A
MDHQASANVSEREAEVLAALGEHLTNTEIAQRLQLSVRTVESHVSSLLRKLGVGHRRALARLAAPAEARSSGLPTPLTAFVGRAAERAALAELLAGHRLVSAVGPGGIGKTRLALAVAGELTGRYADGVRYVDLVPVTEEGMLAPAVLDALGLGEQPGRSAEESVLAHLADRQVLLVVDNCEHLVGAVVVLVERLLTECPRVRVLATSRARLLVPHERVYSVPGLTVTESGGDAVELFLDRAAAADSPAADRRQVARICRGLDGMALAIELAAARLPALGLTGLADGLADRLHLLAGGRRLNDRHRSLRATLDWSHALLTGPEQELLRRVCVFAAAFTADAAAAVLAGRPPTGPRVTAALAALADHSLLTVVQTPDGTRYRMLETIRQYGAELLDRAGGLEEARLRHLHWCQAELAATRGPLEEGHAEGRAAFDRIADEALAALEWAAGEPARRAEGYGLALTLAELFFARGRPGEGQRRFEQAAALAPDHRAAADALACAASAAEIRHFGGEGIRLHRACAEAALRAGDRPLAGYQLAQAAELIVRAPGLVQGEGLPEPAGLAAEALALAEGDPKVRARVAVVGAYLLDGQDPHDPAPAERAIALARRAGDPLAESAALDQLSCVHLARGEIRAAEAAARRRVELTAAFRHRPLAAGLELFDSCQMAAETFTASGDLAAARELADQVRHLPFYREEGHLATARLLVVTALTGAWAEHSAFADCFLDGWERAGRPRAGNLSRAPYAAAAVCGLRGDDAGRARWLGVVEAVANPSLAVARIHHGDFFDALVLLHHGRAEEALTLLATAPEELAAWYSGMWRPWYAAVWAEAAVLADDPSAADRIARARLNTAGNPVALAVVERSAALAAGDRTGLLAAADQLLAGGCRYQWARTLALAGGPDRARGEAELAAIGAAPMALP